MVLKKIGKSCLYIFMFIVFFHSQYGVLQAKVIKFATILPDGAPGMAEMQKAWKELYSKTNGEIEIKTGAGGIAGDELEVLEKMKSNRIQMGVFSLLGLVKILPEAIILSHLGLYQNADEAEYIRKILYKKLYEDFYWEGFVLLCLIDAGPIYLCSSIDLSDTNNISKIKLWAYKGDEVFINVFQELGVEVIPLPVSDVIKGFNVGIINTVYGPPFSIPAFQLLPRVRYILEYPFAYLPSAFLITKTAFEDLSKESQLFLTNYANNECVKNIATVRKMNSEAMDILKGSGVKVVPPTDKHMELIHKSIELFTDNILQKKIYSENMLNEIKTRLLEYRKNRTKK